MFLKNYQNISEATRDNVMRGVKELGYMPNVMASHLSSKSSRRVALYVYINDECIGVYGQTDKFGRINFNIYPNFFTFWLDFFIYLHVDVF